MSIYKKLLEAKKEIGKVAKNAKNPHYKNTYADVNALIEAVEPILLEKGLIMMQPIKEGKVFTIIQDVESAESVESFIELPTNTNPQQTGSAITYYRRYTLQGLLSLQAEDDDGQRAVTPVATVLKVLNEKEVEEAVSMLEATTIEELNTRFKLLSPSAQANKEVIQTAVDIKANLTK